jgi:hypothetical protein
MASPASGPNKGRPIVGPKNPGKPDMKIQPMPVRGSKKPVPRISPDDKVIRKMPITESQLKQIKRYYGIK